jgi:ABC-type multidrug transport system permease subunit
MFSGFFIKRPDIPVYWLWLFYISYTNYGITAFLFNEFDGNDTYVLYTLPVVSNMIGHSA